MYFTHQFHCYRPSPSLMQCLANGWSRVEEQIGGGQVPLEEQLEQASEAYRDARDATAEKDGPPVWALMPM